jgi:hypothetical protein
MRRGSTRRNAGRLDALAIHGSHIHARVSIGDAAQKGEDYLRLDRESYRRTLIRPTPTNLSRLKTSGTNSSAP